VAAAFLVNDFTAGGQTVVAASGAVAANDDLTVVVYEGRGPVDDQGVYAEVRDADGVVVVESFRVNSTTRGDHQTPSVGMAHSGAFVVVWSGRGPGDKQGVFFQRYSSTGAALGGETLVNTTVAAEQGDPAVAAAADGSFVVVWSGVGVGDSSGVFLQRFGANGVAQGSETRVNTTTANDQTNPAVAFDGEGNLFVAWQSRQQDGADWGIYGQRFSATGERLGVETRLNSTTAGSQTNPSVRGAATCRSAIGPCGAMANDRSPAVAPSARPVSAVTSGAPSAAPVSATVVSVTVVVPESPAPGRSASTEARLVPIRNPATTAIAARTTGAAMRASRREPSSTTLASRSSRFGCSEDASPSSSRRAAESSSSVGTGTSMLTSFSR